jgi:TolB protein
MFRLNNYSRIFSLLSCIIAFNANLVFAQNADTIHFDGENHFANVRQLTFGGDNAEAYCSYDSKSLVFQRTNKIEGVECDQIFYGKLPTTITKRKLFGKSKVIKTGFNFKQVSTGQGRTTCSYPMPDGKSFIYASTHLSNAACPAVPDRNVLKKYVWPIYKSFDIFQAGLDGKILKQLTNDPGYDAEAVVNPQGTKIIFTSMRNGDLDLYTMNLDGTDVKQITFELGYDGGAWFSPDGTKIVWRASRPKTDEEIKEYTDLLNQDLVMPTNMEVFIADADGSNVQQVTSLKQANWAPNFTPDGKQIIFASNHEHKRGFPFNLYLINLDGTGLEKISRDGGFDAFPAFSPDGKKLFFSSNRNNKGTRDTNVFMCDWVK